MIWLVVVLVVAAVVGGVTLAGRRHREESGVVKFQRHIDALSPQARRESFERVRPQLPPDVEER